MPRKQHLVRLTPDDRRTLIRLVRTGRQSAWTLQRARILLLADTTTEDPTRSDAEVATSVGVVPRTVARARAAGARSIWIRTGGRQGYYGNQFLPALVPAAHAAGIKVVAWDFPFLSDPVADAARAKQALDLGIDAFAPDVETTAEGTHATARRVALYLSLVRSYAGTRPVAATVPRPTPIRRKSFPYAAFAPYADLFVPMIYWSCNEPGKLVQQSLTELGRWLPVAPVGQAYDMGTEGGRSGLPTRAETWRFLDTAKRGGAVGASLWTIEKVGTGQWDALRSYPWDAPAG